jgi:PAS domain S-box-containing protein
MDNPPTIDQVLKEKQTPVISANDKGLVTFINQAFTKAYGWQKTDLVGQSLSLIVPQKMRETHQLGFSRLISTNQPKIIGQTLKLPILTKNNQELQAEHIIYAEKKDQWIFAAFIKKI